MRRVFDICLAVVLPIGLTVSWLGLALMLLSGFVPAPQARDTGGVEWLGRVVYAEQVADGTYAGMNIVIDKKYELGVRPDGLLCARIRKKDEESP